MKKPVFLAMLFVLTINITANVWAQKLSSKRSYGVTVNFELGNATNKNFTSETTGIATMNRCFSITDENRFFNEFDNLAGYFLSRYNYFEL